MVPLRLDYFRSHLGYTKAGLLNFCLCVCSCSSEPLFLFSRYRRVMLLWFFFYGHFLDLRPESQWSGDICGCWLLCSPSQASSSSFRLSLSWNGVSVVPPGLLEVKGCSFHVFHGEYFEIGMYVCLTELLPTGSLGIISPQLMGGVHS